VKAELVRAGARWLKFNLVGALGIGVQVGVLVWLTKRWHFEYMCATALAVEAAVLHNFVWHERFTWANNGSQRLSESLRRFLSFNASNGMLSIGGNLLLMRWLVGHLHLGAVLANLLSIAACSLANFLVCDNWVFRCSSRNQKERAIADIDRLNLAGAPRPSLGLTTK
jgi:putative flippase GtrA